VISRLSAPGHPCWAGLVAEGRAPHAREGNLGCTRGLPRLGHRPFARPSMIMSCHGLRQALTLGRAERVPPRKSPSALPPGFSPQGHPSLDIPPSGGAGSARPQTALWLHPDTSPLGLGAFAQTSRVMRCPGMNTTLQRGRAERVPPRKPPPRDLQALRAGASVLRTPRRGGAGSARPLGKPWLHPGIAPFRPPSVRSPLHDHVMLRLAPGLDSRTRRARPSEKTTSP
jgi:hypothetical protein